MTENAILTIQRAGTTAWGGMWFVVYIEGVSKDKEGSSTNWLDPDFFTSDKEVFSEDTEEPEYAYVELDPERGVANTKMVTFRADQDPHAPVDVYLYSKTTPVEDAKRATHAVHMAVKDALEKWEAAPYQSGEKRVLPAGTRMMPGESYAEEIFDIDTAFHGVDP
jgi:hypothetical protein